MHDTLGVGKGEGTEQCFQLSHGGLKSAQKVSRIFEWTLNKGTCNAENENGIEDC